MEEYYCIHCGASILAVSEDDLERCSACGKAPRDRAQKVRDAAAAAIPAGPSLSGRALRTGLRVFGGVLVVILAIVFFLQVLAILSGQ